LKTILFAGAAALGLMICTSSAQAQDISHQTPKAAQQRANLERQKAEIQAQIDALDQSAQPAGPSATSMLRTTSSVAEIIVTGRSQPIMTHPIGQTVVNVSGDMLKDTPAFSVGDILKLAPGVSFTQGNGPRDVSVSVRGSNERQTFAIRNIQVFEDGFPVTQPDGTARSDLTDPHAYGNVTVVEGPSSALYGNYATGGMINFQTRPGGEINGVESGFDFGSYGYVNAYATVGAKGDNYEYAGFISGVRGDGFTRNNGYDTITENVLATYAVTPHDRVTFKLINNDLDTNLSIRLSQNQYRQNPFQQNCLTVATVGCAGVTLFNNGFNGATTKDAASQVDLGRHDRRTVIGARYEHDLDSQTTWTTTFDFDNRDIRQPTSSTDFRGTYPSFNIISDVTRRSSFMGLPSTTLVGGFFNYENFNSTVFNVLPVAGPTDGGLTQTVNGHQLNAGLRAREELELSPTLSGVLGLGVEYTELQALEVNFSYPVNATPVPTTINPVRTFFNTAPEASLIYRPDNAWTLHARVSTGYGTPQGTNLFVTPQGTFGNNTQLKTQTNTGVDLGAEWTPGPDLHLTATGFYEWFDNELVTQSAGVNLQSYTFNAPHSEHRGVEFGLDWRPLPTALPGAKLFVSYLYDDQIYTTYVEQLTSGAVTSTFNRSGNHIPGVTPSVGTIRLIYDQPDGALRGAGGFIEATGRDAYQLDNANLIQASGYLLLNLDVHYDPPAELGLISRARFYIDVQNLLDQRYIASASNITDSLNTATKAENPAGVLANSTGSIYAGQPISVFGGVRVKF
jgi:iron complex outermembrane receptor protein